MMGAARGCEALHQGDGIGLESVRRQLAAHFPGEGRVEVATRPGGGFTVTLSLPARLAAQPRRQ